jgi:hypothetical protein
MPHTISEQSGGPNVPAAAASRKQLAQAVERMIAGAQQDGAIRSDLPPPAPPL